GVLPISCRSRSLWIPRESRFISPVRRSGKRRSRRVWSTSFKQIATWRKAGVTPAFFMDVRRTWEQRCSKLFRGGVVQPKTCHCRHHDEGGVDEPDRY